MTRLNWSRSFDRTRMRAHGTETVGGASMPPGGAPAARVGAAKRRKANPTPPTHRTLAEIDKFWRDRGGRAVIVRLIEYNGHKLVDLRTFFTADDGTLRPAKGFACNVQLLPRLARAIAKAIAKARDLGLIRDEAGA